MLIINEFDRFDSEKVDEEDKWIFDFFDDINNQIEEECKKCGVELEDMEEKVIRASDETKVRIHKKICDYIHDLYEKKNADYGNSFAKVREKYNNSICVRLNDKLTRLETLMNPEHKQQVNDESIDDTLVDIANYAIMELVERMSEVKVSGANKQG